MHSILAVHFVWYMDPIHLEMFVVKKMFESIIYHSPVWIYENGRIFFIWINVIQKIRSKFVWKNVQIEIWLIWLKSISFILVIMLRSVDMILNLIQLCRHLVRYKYLNCIQHWISFKINHKHRSLTILDYVLLCQCLKSKKNWTPFALITFICFYILADDCSIIVFPKWPSFKVLHWDIQYMSLCQVVFLWKRLLAM